MANYNKMTAAKFNAIKLLLEGGASTQEAAKYMKVCAATIYQVGRHESFDDYQQYQTERILAGKKKREEALKAAEQKATKDNKPEQTITQVVEHRQSVTIQATHYMMEELRKTNELLTLISAKLAFIVDELCGTTPKKEG